MNITRNNKNLLRFSAPHVWAAIFLVSTLIAEFVLLFPSHELAILADHLSNGRYLRLAAVFIVSLISIALSFFFIYAALRSGWFARSFCLIIFGLISVAEYSFHRVTGRFSNMNLLGLGMFAGNYGLITDAARQYVSWLGLVPTVALALVMLAVKPDRTHNRYLWALLLLTLVLFFSASTLLTRNEYYTTALSAGMRSVAEYPIVWFVGTVREYPRRSAFNAPRTQLNPISAPPPSNNIVFIVDESVRADHLSLNGYAVPTTPFLNELQDQGMLKNWGTAASGGTCSVQSNNLLLTGMRIEADPDFNIYRLPTIFQYAREMGYTTYLYDGQTAHNWLGKPSDLNFVDKKISPEDLGTSDDAADVDAAIAKRVEETVQHTKGNFIWINKAGVHSKPFTDVYPRLEYDPSTKRDLLVAAYDRAITTNLQQFFGVMLPDARPAADTIYIYTSDHGQTLMENGAKLSHCTDLKIEASVPLFAISNPEYTEGADTSLVASHANIFSALLDLMKVPNSERRYDYAPSFLSTPSTESKPRSFKAGDAADQPGAIIKFDQ